MSDVDAVFQEHRDLALSTAANAQQYIAAAFAAFGNVYPHYLGIGVPTTLSPFPDRQPPDIIVDPPPLPLRNNLPPEPRLDESKTNIPNFGASAPSDSSLPQPPSLLDYPAPGTALPTLTATAPTMPPAPVFPDTPTTLPLPAFLLPYPTVTLPDAPVLEYPVFAGQQPEPIDRPSFQEYLDLLRSSYDRYSEEVFQLIKSHWREWLLVMLEDQPLIGELRAKITSYLATGGAGVPVPIEDAIVERARSRTQAEYRRMAQDVWEGMESKGLYLASGPLMAGLRIARQKEAEAIGQVVTDVAIKNIDIEHKHMQFMLGLAKDLEVEIMKVSVNVGQLVTSINSQAIDLTKMVLTGMIEIHNIIVRIYQAEWEGYKSAVEIYKARLDAVRLQVSIYEAQIKAELAKVEINKAYVDVLTAVVSANKNIIEMYKAQIEAETAKVEYYRIQAQVFGELVRAYVAQIEGWKAEWDGFKAKIDANLSKTKIYEAEIGGFTARVNAFKAKADAYASQVQGLAAQADARFKSNRSLLDSWTARIEGLLKIDALNVEVYKTEWQAAVEQVKADVAYWQALTESENRQADREANLFIEMRREALSDWQQRMQAQLQAAQGMSSTSGVAAQLAGSTMSGVTSFAGKLVEEGGL